MENLRIFSSDDLRQREWEREEAAVKAVAFWEAND